MPKSPPILDILQRDGFSVHYLIGRLFKIGFLGQCCIVAALGAIGMLSVSWIDHSWVLRGNDIGLLEHPALWGFPMLQILLPLCVRQSLRKLQTTHLRDGEIKKISDRQSVLIAPVRRFLGWQGKASKIAAGAFYLIGFAVVVWNTYQNQRPGTVVPFDFWDSKNFVYGFVFTRIYKLYLFVWFLPYLGMIQAAILVVTLRFVRRARIAGKLKLFPFHPDGVGGLGLVSSLISMPVIITVVVGSLATAVVFYAHRGVAVTPFVALGVLVSWILVAYFVPILVIRSDIVALKREALKKLRNMQQENYVRITDRHAWDVEMLGKGNEALDYFDKVCAKIEAISNFPHLSRLLKFSSLSLLPSLIQIGFKLYQNIGPIVTPFSKSP
jgi:hypothetical protein